jgi:hypothetical protein
MQMPLATIYIDRIDDIKDQESKYNARVDTPFKTGSK